MILTLLSRGMMRWPIAGPNWCAMRWCISRLRSTYLAKYRHLVVVIYRTKATTRDRWSLAGWCRSSLYRSKERWHLLAVFPQFKTLSRYYFYPFFFIICRIFSVIAAYFRREPKRLRFGSFVSGCGGSSVGRGSEIYGMCLSSYFRSYCIMRFLVF